MNDTTLTYRDRIDAACRLIEERLDEDLSLEEVARAAHFSPFHFHRLFRGLKGETVRAHVRRLRLERGAFRLTQSDMDILAIAVEAGYSSHEAFTRAFKERFDVTPSTYRDEKREFTAHQAETLAPIDVRFDQRAAGTVAFARHVGPYDQVGDAWKTLMKWGWSKMMLGKPTIFGLAYDDPDVTDPAQLRYDACMMVSPKTKPKRGVEVRAFAGGPCAVAVHEGAYDQIGLTYARLFAHVADHPLGGRRRTLAHPPALEHYLNDPRSTPPDELRTEIWMPVE